jgi:hypothetical protein
VLGDKPQCHSAHHKSHLHCPETEPGSKRTEAGLNYGTTTELGLTVRARVRACVRACVCVYAYIHDGTVSFSQ